MLKWCPDAKVNFEAKIYEGCFQWKKLDLAGEAGEAEVQVGMLGSDSAKVLKLKTHFESQKVKISQSPVNWKGKSGHWPFL